MSASDCSRICRRRIDQFSQNNMGNWDPALVARRPDTTIEQVSAFLAKMYRANADFVFTVTRDFVRACQTPILILPDDIPPHPYAVAMEAAMLAPNAQVSMSPSKDVPRRFRSRSATSERSCKPTDQ